MEKSIKPPRGERVWTTWHSSDGSVTHVITSKDARDYYYIYSVGSDGSLTKLGKAKSPPELEDRFVGERVYSGGTRRNVGKADTSKSVDT